MKKPQEGQSTFASAPTHAKQAVKPNFPNLQSLPETPEALFRSLALIVTATVSQPDPAGKKSPKKHDYALPWEGFETWRDARFRLEHFEKTFKG